MQSKMKYFNIECLIFCLVLCLGFYNLKAQLYFEGTKTGEEITVRFETKQVFRFPWAGGMNSCQFGEIDLNMDGKNDLFVFDRHGDRIMTFTNNGTSGEVDYDYAPEYINKFPEMNDWAILADYNMDGKPDIFTLAHGLPGILVYRNTSVLELEFELEVYPYLTSFQGGGYVNILVTDVDYPAISDIDGDGDLDILTFWGLGSFVELHKNQSIEKYGTPDSLDFMKTSNCWGRFAENDEGNTIYLDTCIGTGFYGDLKSRHTGSTFLLIDLDNDMDKDLLLGDVDYPNLIQLVNGGTPDSAFMESIDTLFPSYDKPVNLFSMPCAAYIDINNDQINDLILSPFDPGLTTSQNQRSVWLYLNQGGNAMPEFHFETNNFLQNEMIDVGSGAYPVLADFDGDGLVDLFISNYGDYIYSTYGSGNILQSVYWSNVTLFRNTGSANQPAFSRITHNFANLQEYHLKGIYLTFGDIDGDQDEDMVLGHSEGNLWFFENTAGQGQPMNFIQPVQLFQDIDVGAFSTPQLFDLNADALTDLIIGEENGNLNYYQNTGSVYNPVFTFITDSLGKVNVTNYQLSYTGYSTPCFFKDIQNKTCLLVGSEQGKVFYYKNIDDNLGGEFVENDSLYLLINNQTFEMQNGIRTGAAIRDLNNDDYFDLLVGNYSGGINLYSGIEAPPANGINFKKPAEVNVTVFPNPAKESLQIKIQTLLPNEKVEIFLYNLLSEQIFCKSFEAGQQISVPVQDLPSGLYLLRVQFFPNIPNCLYKKVMIIR